MGKKIIKLSCIILSCDPGKAKGNCILHCLTAIFAQKFKYFEVILIENSHHKKNNIPLIRDTVRELNKRRPTPIAFSLINNKQSYGYGKARNIGAERASSNLLVFVDDDTIILDNSAFQKIFCLSRNFDYGYGAKRLWTRQGWFPKNTKKILNKMENGEIGFLKHNAGLPPALFRDPFFQNIKQSTFIANFGFCKKDIFKKLGGFPNYSGYGFEDDFLMFRLYELGYRFMLMNDFLVIHVSHRAGINQQSNLVEYFLALIERGYFSFHVINTFSGKPMQRRTVLEKLKPIHYDFRIEEAYEDYIRLIPLDIQLSDRKTVSSWRKNNMIEKMDFACLMRNLQNSNNVDEFIKNSSADFDNIGVLIDVGIKNEIVKVEKNGKVKKIFNFHFTKKDFFELIENPSFVPNCDLNQFPCDFASRKRRFDLFKERYPFTEYLKFGIIGDDDLVSLEFINEFWAYPVIIEKDDNITKIIKKASPRFKVIKFDIRKIIKADGFPEVQTFITDPPYTIYGALAFIFAGLRMLVKNNNVKEFYVILNQTMIGKNLLKLQQILSRAGVYLIEIRRNFSQYKLPMHFSERKRADRFLDSLAIDRSSSEYSSSSDLFIFRTIDPDIDWLGKQINFKKFYIHYL
ncbi:MAG TPA: bis-aminopropyl spermidine synthase family protein [Candidatus Bipolaricaulota bacterium]|nr:bis-aminopropyl spermidine synthase family protein [Candidatus Bipolaricaulota bacterium]